MKQKIFFIDENGHSFKVAVWDWFDETIEDFFKAREKFFGSGLAGQNPCSERWRLKNYDHVWMLLSHPEKEFIEGRVNDIWVNSKEEFFRALKLLVFE